MAKGWDKESLRHSMAKKLGKAPPYRAKKKEIKIIKPKKNFDEKAKKILAELKEEFEIQRNADDFWSDYSDDFKETIKKELEKGSSVEDAKEKGYEEIEVYRSEGDHIATITIKRPDGEEDKIDISEYSIYDDTREGYGEDFIPRWHKTSAWRGYYEIDARGWTAIHEDTALSYTEDAAELEKFNDELISELNAMGIPVAQAVSRTSNAFSSSVDYYVPDQNASDVEEIVKGLKKKYRDEDRFTSTALTGADPKDQTKTDKKFVKAVKKMRKKEIKAVDLMKDILKETKRKEKGAE